MSLIGNGKRLLSLLQILASISDHFTNGIRLKDNPRSIGLPRWVRVAKKSIVGHKDIIACRYFKNWASVRHNQNTMPRIFLIKVLVKVQSSAFYSEENLLRGILIQLKFYVIYEKKTSKLSLICILILFYITCKFTIK